MKHLFSVLDTKSGIFSAPFCSVNENTATRDFGHACNDPTTDLNRYPGDFVLVKLGTYDETSAQIEVLQVHKHLGFASQFINPTESSES